MRIRSTETIAGFPILRVRDALRGLRDPDSWGAEALECHLKDSPDKVQALIGNLEGQGYIERTGNAPEASWHVTDLGSRFANATATRPMSRPTAERLAREFLARVDEVNRNSYYLYRVQKVVVFGSFLTESPTLGDLDLAVTLESREPDPDRRRTRENERIAHAAESGRHFSNFTDQLFWPQREILLHLKGRSGYIKIHSDKDAVLARTRTKVIFPSTSGNR